MGDARKKRYTVLTNSDGYFEIHIPERNNYSVAIRDTYETFSIPKPAVDEIIKIYSEKR